ncbi:MAG: MEDS domain-containing protein [Deltaproteobacteria bacterium]|nr:MEDS domain-containing protein [Deltaproteobacteria bacterium]
METEQPDVNGIATLKPGDHICCLYETDDQRRPMLTPFLRQGLDQNEKVLYIADAGTAETVMEYLRAESVDVGPYLGRGQLNILTAREAYLRGGTFDPGEMIALLRAETEQALSQGYGALRVTGEMTWAVRDLPGSDRLIEYEALLNDFFPGSRCLALCQYDMRRFAPDLLLDVLRTHPLAVIGAEIYENPHYIPPSNLLGMDPAACDLRHWMQDMVNRKKAEAALRESETYFREITENASDMILIVDEKGSITYASPSVERFLGYGPQVLIGKGVFDFIHPDDIQRAMLDFAQAVQTEETEIPNSFRVFHKDGSERVVEGLGRNLLHHPIVSGFIMNVHDVTESRRLQTQLLRAQKTEAIATLTGGIAHDYNNLVSIIMGNLALAALEAPSGSDQADFLKEADKAVKRVRDLTHELIALSRGGAPVKEVGSLKPLLADSANVVPADSGISLNTLIPDDLWPVPYDPYKMGSVFRNVLTNAVEAMPDGGTLTIRAENLHVEDGDEDLALPLVPGDYVKATIGDQGKGIPAQDLGKIFDPYFSTKPMGVQKGMGLGLATAHAIVQKHGGYIAVDTVPGGGTTVSIYLQAERAEGPSEAGAAPEKQVPRFTGQALHGAGNQQSSIQRVLVMDDEESLRKLAVKILSRLFGCEVVTAKDGPGAIEAYQRQMDSGEPFDAVILDLTIKGGMGGDQVIKELLKMDPNVGAIVCSGYFNDPVMANFKDYGFKGAMAKPFAMKDVKEALGKVLLRG